MVRVGGERLLVPELRVLVAAELAAGVTDEIGDLGIVVVVQRPHGGDAGLVLAFLDQRARLVVALAQLLLGLLVLLFLLRALLLLLLLPARIGSRVGRKPFPARVGCRQRGAGRKCEGQKPSGRDKTQAADVTCIHGPPPLRRSRRRPRRGCARATVAAMRSWFKRAVRPSAPARDEVKRTCAGKRPRMAGAAGQDLVRHRAFDDALELGVFLARRVAADQPHLFQVVLGHQHVALLGVPHAVVGPGAHVIRVGGERLLVPELRILVAAKLAAGIADEVGDLRIVVMAERVHGGNAGFVLAAHDQGARMLIAFAQLLLRSLLLLVLLLALLGLALLAALIRARRWKARAAVLGRQQRPCRDGKCEQRRRTYEAQTIGVTRSHYQPPSHAPLRRQHPSIVRTPQWDAHSRRSPAPADYHDFTLPPPRA